MSVESAPQPHPQVQQASPSLGQALLHSVFGNDAEGSEQVQRLQMPFALTRYVVIASCCIYTMVGSVELR